MEKNMDGTGETEVKETAVIMAENKDKTGESEVSWSTCIKETGKMP